jgi:glycine hydroxymethyltransferase
VLAAKAVALSEASKPEFAGYARRVVDNARALAEALVERGVRVLTGGTDNHLVMLDVRGYGLTGRQAEAALRAADLTCNRNVIPNDPNGAWYTSGLRLGSPAATTLGMGPLEMREVADVLHSVLTHTRAGRNGEQASQVQFETQVGIAQRAKARVAELLARHRLYPELDLE